MKYNLSIRESNIPAHLDIEKDISVKKNGNFTFTIRTNNGNISDYNVTEFVPVRQKYLAVKSVIVEKLVVTHHIGIGSNGNTIRTDDV